MSCLLAWGNDDTPVAYKGELAVVAHLADDVGVTHLHVLWQFYYSLHALCFKFNVATVSNVFMNPPVESERVSVWVV